MATAGYITEPTAGSTTIENQIVGINLTMTEAGYVTDVKVWLEVTTASHNIKCALYKLSDYSFVAETEEKLVGTQAKTLTTFNFASPPYVGADDYVVVAWSDNPSGNAVVWRNAVGGWTRYLDGDAYGAWPDPLVPATAGSIAHGIYIDYSTTIVAPTVTTQPAGSLWKTAAVGNGTITSTGGENATPGFDWDIDSGAPYANSVVGGAAVGSGDFALLLDSLPAGTTIYYRAKATNAGGTGYGTEESFTTRTADALEDWTAVWVNTDVQSRQTTFAANEITVANVSKDDDLDTVYDHSADYWNPTIGKWAWAITAMMPTGFTGPSDHLTFLAISNGNPAYYDSDPLLMVYGYFEASFPVADRLRIYLKAFDSSIPLDYLESIRVDLDTTYYLTLVVQGGNATLYVYSDVGKTTLVGSLTTVAPAIDCRYTTVMASRNGPGTGVGGAAEGTITDLSFAEDIPTGGGGPAIARFNGILAANIAKVNGIPWANIAKIDGVG